MGSYSSNYIKNQTFFNILVLTLCITIVIDDDQFTTAFRAKDDTANHCFVMCMAGLHPASSDLSAVLLWQAGALLKAEGRSSNAVLIPCSAHPMQRSTIVFPNGIEDVNDFAIRDRSAGMGNI